MTKSAIPGQSTYFMHYRKTFTGADVQPHGGVTVAIRPQEDGKKATLALAQCSRADVFNKKLGRSIAVGRLNAFIDGRDLGSNVIVIDIDPETNLKVSVDDALHESMQKLGYC